MVCLSSFQTETATSELLDKLQEELKVAEEKVEWERRERKRTDEQYGKLKVLCNKKDLDFEKLDEEKSGKITGTSGNNNILILWPP